MATAKLTSKGQVTIPKQIRESQHWRAGDRLEFKISEDGKVILEQSSGDVRQLRGLLKRPGKPPVSVEQMDAAIARHLTRKARQR